MNSYAWRVKGEIPCHGGQLKRGCPSLLLPSGFLEDVSEEVWWVSVASPIPWLSVSTLVRHGLLLPMAGAAEFKSFSHPAVESGVCGNGEGDLMGALGRCQAWPARSGPGQQATSACGGRWSRVPLLA
ncbi:hypothetical protein Dimus_030615 [Dionaea muscipula]